MCSAPCEVERWLREKQRTLDHHHLQDLFHATVHALQEEIPGLGEVVAIDVKHQYAWVRENNFRESIKDRFCKERQPRGDPDCRVGVKSSTNQEQADGSKKERKEYLWGYGSGIATATTPDYGDMALADLTQAFNASDVSYYLRLYIQTVAVLGFFPLHVTADAAYDAWYVYQTCAHREGIVAIPLNGHGHEEVPRDRDGVPLCPIGLRMHPTYRFLHTKGSQAQRYRCPLLFPQRTGETCEHEQFLKDKGCVKDINIEKGGLMRAMLDRSSPLYRAVYRQRTSAERINSQAKARCIERPKVREARLREAPQHLDLHRHQRQGVSTRACHQRFPAHAQAGQARLANRRAGTQDRDLPRTLKSRECCLHLPSAPLFAANTPL